MKFLKRPLNIFYINQNFGSDMSCLQLKDRKTVVTKKTEDTCPVGYESLYKLSGLKGHNGLDLSASHGMPIYSAFDGWVEEVQTEEARGLGLGIVSTELYPCTELNNANTQFKVRYWHLKSFEVEKNNPVKKGDLIGYADNTGYSSGDHLHFELKPVTVKNGKVTNTLQNNGYFGAVNPLPYLEDGVFQFTRNLYMGQTLDDVQKLQDLLKKLGLLEIDKTTRFYGNMTRVAVMRLQNLSGIPTNYGVAVGPLTRARLNELLG